MFQARYYVRTSRSEADRIFSALEQAFEDDGAPLAATEIDEAADVHEVSLYADRNDNEAARRFSDIVARFAPGAEPAREDIPDIDWVTRSLEGLKPVRAGRFMVHGSHDRRQRRVGDIAIEIEAGLAFGTGHHATTAGCLEMIAKVARRERPRNALDLGTGSAVLAIALAKLLRIPVLATDIDPVAVRVAAQNARLNNVAAYVSARTAPGFRDPVFSAGGPFDLIVANILARPLMRLAPEMARHVSRCGSIILSGILERQRDAVVAAYVGQQFRHVETLRRDGWVTLYLKR